MSDFLKIEKHVLKELGDISATMMIADLYRWSLFYREHQRNYNFHYPENINPADGWFYRSAEKFEEDWLLTRRPMERARKLLIEGGYIETRRAGIPARTWYRVTEKGEDLVCAKQPNNDEHKQSCLNNDDSLDCPKRTNIHTEEKTNLSLKNPPPPEGGNQTAEPLVLDSQEEERREKRIQIAKMELPTWISRESWQDFIQHRKALRKPMTARAAELILNRLTKIAAEHGETGAQLALLDAIANGWQSPYPPKDQAFRGAGYYQTASDRSNELLDRWLKEGGNGNEEHDRTGFENMGSEYRQDNPDGPARTLAGGVPGGSRQSVHSSPEETPARDAGSEFSDDWASLGITTSPAPRRSIFG